MTRQAYFTVYFIYRQTMAKKQNNYDKKHNQNIKTYTLQLYAIYREAIKEAVSISGTVGNIKSDKPFSFDDYPITRKRIDHLMSSLQSDIQAVIVNGIKAEWTLANNKNSELANRVFGKNVGKLTQAQYRRYYSTNDAARQAFQQRKVGGLNLSDRVWRYTEQFKEEIEMGLDIGIRSGRSANEISRDLRQYLKQPDKLFRRVRDEHGQLHLSKRAKAYHPGQGVNRSSFKNARRLAATETNIAYRTADHMRWQQMDFVVGIEIHLSANHTLNGKPFHDICDELQGQYPKDFKFTGWHPLCRCFVTSILKTQEEIDRDTQKILNGEPVDDKSVNRVDDVPQAFKDWVQNNGERIAGASSLPYFLRDNETLMQKILAGEATATPPVTSAADLTAQIVAQDKTMFTPKQIANLDKLEQELGIKRGLAMPFQQASEGRANPDFSTGKYEYTCNCQCCAVAYEMRRRGFDVRATERTKTGVPADLAWSTNRTMAYLDPATNQRPTEQKAGGATVTKNGAVRAKSERLLATEGNDLMRDTGRYQISLSWKQDDGHRLSAERFADGTLTVYDPQSGKRWSSFAAWVADHKGMIDVKRGVGILRTDDKLINPQYIGGIVKKN